ncbi:GntR family transcriptional regulator [Streptomyces sp. 7R007]
MRQSAQGSAGTGMPAAGPGVPRVPQQPGAADVDRRVRGTGHRGVDAGAARGEHTHSEQPMPGARSLQRPSVRGQILDALRTALAAGELTPGEVYSAPALGERFGVSATPVREAMQQLALEGAVEVVPNRGFRVVRRGARELAELAEVRALIEVPVLLRLARTVPVERWAELRPLAEATVRAAAAGCPAGYAESDRAFHRAVLGLAGNEQLVQIADDLHRRTVTARTDLLADAAQHGALLDALITRDTETARSLLNDHFTPPARP